MKVYIVTCGYYSDYHIKKVFLDKEKAEEYAQWLPNNSFVGEYETADDSLVISKKYKICATLSWKKDGSEKLSVDLSKDCEADEDEDNYEIYYEYSDHDELYIVRTILDNGNFDEQYWENKIEKIAYDVKAYVLHLKSEGFSEFEIWEMVDTYEQKHRGKL